MGPQPEPVVPLPPAVEAVRSRVDGVLEAFLADRREELHALDPDCALLVEEIQRLVGAGGKRLRPAFCYWGFRAAGGTDGEPIVRAASALELLHTFALIHDDVMDGADTRRGVPASHVRLAGEAELRGLPGSPERFGLSAAVLVGDLCAVLADRLLSESGFEPEKLAAASVRYDRMRGEMAAGQILDLLRGSGSDPERARRIALLKTGSYTVEGPLMIGAILAGGSAWAMTCLSHFGAPLGEAFQVRDDLLDGGPDLPGEERTRERIDALVRRATSALDPAALSPEAVGVLRSLAGSLAVGM